MRLAIVAIIVLAAGTARAGVDVSFVGWSADGTYYVTRGMTCAQDLWAACPTPHAKPTWPASFGAPGDDCVDSDTNDKVTADVEKLVADRGAASAPDVKIALTAKGEKATIKISRRGKTLTFTVEDIEHAELADARWRKDGKVVALSLQNSGRTACSNDIHRIVVYDVAELGAGAPPGDRKAAQAANVRGMQALAKTDFAAADAAFRDAIRADDRFLLARYNLASVASIRGDVATVRAELAQLASSTDPEAKKMLDKAKRGDPDFDFATIDPDVRARLGMPAYPTKTAARLFERNGVWSTEADGCDKPAAMVVFANKGKEHDRPLAVTYWPCGGKPITKQRSWSEGLEELFFVIIPGLGDQPKLHWTRCDGSDVDGSCFVANERVFHRGVPRKR
jgi:hypothetical protein